ncbi:MAG: hypothetical protein ACO35E_11535, partial [Ilumatobacteraceae bacterium]
MSRRRRMTLAGFALAATLLPSLARSPGEAAASPTPTASLDVTGPPSLTTRASLDPTSPSVVPLPVTVTQYYTAWPEGWDATVAPSLTATVTLTGSDPGAPVLDGSGLAVTVTNPTTTSLVVTGPSDDVAAALASRLSLEVPISAGGVDVSVDVEHNLPARVHQDPSTNRLYRVAPAAQLGGVTWTAARSAATASSIWGLSGYLASVTSQTEHDLIVSAVRPSSGAVRYLLGGSDVGVEGTWIWMDGPDAGVIFSGSSAPPGSFSVWASSEPNDAGDGEDRLRLYVTPTIATWYDVTNDPATRGEASADGAIVEYGGVPQTDDPRRESVSFVVTVRSRYDHLVDYADENGTSQTFPTAPDAAEWTQAGVTGVTTTEFTASLLSLLARPGITGTAVDTTGELQAIVDAYAAVLTHASTSGGSTAPTATQWATLGVTGLDDAAIARLNTAVSVAGLSGVDSADELVGLADVAATTTTTTTSTTTTPTPTLATDATPPSPDAGTSTTSTSTLPATSTTSTTTTAQSTTSGTTA